MTQNDRQLQGNITFTSQGYAGWVGTFTGQLSGDSPTSQFFGNATLTSPATSGPGNCTASAVFSGQTQRNTLRWESPTMRFVPIGTTPGSGCMGDVFTIVWVLGR
jgi:hypothetical protein